MTIELAPLPYGMDALAPVISQRTLEFHYGKHHKGYVDKLNGLIAGTKLEKLSLEKIIAETRNDPAGKAVFNNAAQIWNHSFYWNSMRPQSAARVEAPRKVLDKFGGIDGFKKEFAASATGQFGSGWTWLVAQGGDLKIHSTSNADLPKIEDGVVPLAVSDVWEHAYYLDYQNERPRYIDRFLNDLLNWEFVAANLERA